MDRLPASFTSLYRLFLRASSASVLHQNAARKQLRSLYRPLFDAAAQVVKDLQSNHFSHLERMRRERFLNTFQQRSALTVYSLLTSCLTCLSGRYFESSAQLCAVSRDPSSSDLQHEPTWKGACYLDSRKISFWIKESMESKSENRGQLKDSCP